MSIIAGAVDGGFDALFKVSDKIPDISAKDLIAALPSQNHLSAGARQLGHHELRKGARPRNRIIEVIDQPPHIVDKVTGADVDFVKWKLSFTSHFTRIGAFIIARAN